MAYVETKEEEKWRIQLATELMAVRRRSTELKGFSINEIDEMFKFICIS